MVESQVETSPPLAPASAGIDYNRLFKLRLVVARFGEMDGARWWNTNGVLGKKGALLLSRGFPKTHRFAQARLVFEVARARSAERFPAIPGCMTLWSIPAHLEDEFDARWAQWLEDSDSWAPFFDSLENPDSDLLAMLGARELLSSEQREEVGRMRRSAEGRSVPLSGVRDANDDTLTLLAAGFARGEQGKPAIPYVRAEG
jgi:hypothetical protein